MSKSVKIVRNSDSEMLAICVNGEFKFCGNFWDFSADTWVGVMRSAGVDVEIEEVSDE